MSKALRKVDFEYFMGLMLDGITDIELIEAHGFSKGTINRNIPKSIKIYDVFSETMKFLNNLSEEDEFYKKHKPVIDKVKKNYKSLISAMIGGKIKYGSNQPDSQSD